MEVAISSPVNLDPPPLLFGPRLSTPNPSQSRSSQDSLQFDSHHYRPPPLPSPSTARLYAAEMEHNVPVTSAHMEGQNHDRIDADMGNNQLSSSGNVSETITRLTSQTDGSEEDADDMDTTPDRTQGEDDTASGSLPRAYSLRRGALAAVGVTSDGHDRTVAIERTSGAQASESEDLVRVTSNGSTTDSNDGMEIVQPSTVGLDTAPPGNPENIGPTEAPSQGAGTEAPQADSPPDPEGERGEELVDDEEDPWWTDLVEDNSVPSEEELKDIEQKGPEISALDYCHWEKTFWNELDDPEYVPAEAGRIDWTVENVRGTREKPNRKSVLRSPQKCIGGFYWVIRLYPRGDEMSQLSVYVACSPEPWNDEDEDAVVSDAKDVHSDRHASAQEAVPAVEAAEGGLIPEVRDEELSMQDAPSPPKMDDQVSWAVAAQFGVVLYNPAEPRVQYSFKEQHQFCNDNVDFGRRRFYGPWDEIHLRQRGQRQALLRNDTLSFSAYIRIVKDSTGSLWWSQSEGGSPWDSFAKTGLRSLSTKMDGESFFTAGMAAWLHLAPFQNLIRKVHVPNPQEEPHVRPKPLFAAFQRVLRLTLSQVPTALSVELWPIVEALKWYGLDLRAKIDTLEAWEIIKRKLEQEAEGTVTEQEIAELFGHVSPSADQPLNGELHIEQIAEPNTYAEYPSIKLPAGDDGGVQDALTKALENSKSNAGPVIRSAPKLLQLEIHRQEFNPTARKWKKITNRVELNEHLKFPTQDGSDNFSYSLYGMVVHRGALESGLYYLVVRPGGPRTKWFRFFGEREGYQVQCLTRKQAIRAHEGFMEGERDEETAAVAYLVMYVRDDVFNGEEEGSGFVSQSLKDEVQKDIKEGPTTIAPADDDTTGIVQVKPEEGKLTFRVFHEDVFKAHRGQGSIDVYDSQWSSRQSEYVYHVTLDAKATLADVQREVASLISEGGESKHCIVWVMQASLGTVKDAPNLVCVSTDTALGVVGRDYPLRCLWVAVLPLCKLLEFSPAAAGSEAIDNPVANDWDASATAPHPSFGNNGDDVEMENEQVEILSPTHTNGSTIDQGTAEVTATSGTVAEPPQIGQSVNDGPPSMDQLFTSDFVYIFLKHYDAGKQQLTAVCGLLVNKKHKVLEIVKEHLADADIPHRTQTSTWTIWKEVDLNTAKVVVSGRSFEDEDLVHGSILISQINSSRVEAELIEGRGDFTSPSDYLCYLCLCSNHPNRINGSITQSYFSTEYFSGTLK
ncbi:MAG: hypothetical protein M1830_002160, partial [Pleopsidium flavum]